MGKLVLYLITSLDGAVDDPTRTFPTDTPPPAPPSFDAELEQHEERLISEQSAVLLGRGMYDEWARYWPTVDGAGFAPFINNVKKYVLTSTPLDTEWHNTEAVTGPLPELVTDLLTRTDGDIGVHGSITLAQSLLAADLIDEIQLAVGPVLDPVGRRLSDALPDLRRLDLIDSAATSSGALWLTYRPRRRSTPER